MENKDIFESAENLQYKNITKNNEPYESIKYIKKSVPFEYECFSCEEKIFYKITFDLIEEYIQNYEENDEKKKKQYILITAKPFINKNNYKNKDDYINGIKKSFTYSTFKEKFDYLDFKDSCIKYIYLKESNLINVYNDLLKSVKENKSRIKRNKFHLIFNYYINDFSDIDNSIMLTLDNENEYNILECYGNANQKAYKIQNNINSKEKNRENEIINNRRNRNITHSKSPVRTESKIYNQNKKTNELYSKQINNYNNNNYSEPTNPKVCQNNNNISEFNNRKYSETKDKRRNNKKSNITNTANSTNTNQVRNNNTEYYREKTKEKEINEKEKENENDSKSISDSNKRRNQSPNKMNTLTPKPKTNKNIDKKKQKKIENDKKKEKEKKLKKRGENEKGRSKSINNINNLKGIQSPTKAEKEKITKNFLYAEYNFPNNQTDDEKEKEKEKENSEKNDKKANDKIGQEESESGLSFLNDDYDDDGDEEEEKNDKDENSKKNGKETNTENNFEFQNCNENDEINFDINGKNIINNNNNININSNDSNLLGHKINRDNEQELKNEKIYSNKNIPKEKKNNKSFTTEKNKLNNSQIITIIESDDDTNNNFYSQKLSQNVLKKKYHLVHPNQNNNNEEYNYYDQSSNSISNKSNKSNKSNISMPFNKPISNNNEILIGPYFNNKQYQKPNIYNNNNKLLLKYLSEPSNIIRNILEIQKIKDKIEKCNDLYFKLVYTSLKDKDDYTTFKNAVIDKYRHIILIKTIKDKRFAIYFNEKLFTSKGRPNQEITDMMGFIFSFEKYTFFQPIERLYCFTQTPTMPYMFKLSDFSIFIKNNFKKVRHTLGQMNRVFNIKDMSNELNGGEKDYEIDVLEVYRAEIPNK